MRSNEDSSIELAASTPARRAAQRWISSLSAVALAAVGALAFAGAEGCGGGTASYYCDASGCYQCDGLGCKTVPSPTPPTCKYAGDAACPSGTTCTTIGCEAACKVDSDCASGLVCKAGYCAPPTSDTPKPVVCTLASDCPKGDACIDGACVVEPACTGDGCSCTYDSDCSGGRICADGACVFGCSASAPCATGFTCSAKGTCVESTTPMCGAAAGGVSCPSGEHCVDGRCATGCTDASQCLGSDGKPDSGQACVGGACVPTDHPTPTCGSGKACASGQTCIGGFCHYTCTTDMQCEAIDSRIGSCSKKQSICLPPAEANAQCLSSADCASGQSCISNSCK